LWIAVWLGMSMIVLVHGTLMLIRPVGRKKQEHSHSIGP
jgi:hypothetical protein